MEKKKKLKDGRKYHPKFTIPPIYVVSPNVDLD